MKTKIKYRLTAPVSHIGESASTGSYFQTILTANGRLPVITGNAVRGCLRDAGATHLLDKLGVKVPIEVFNVLFSGGNLSGASKDDLGRAKAVRAHFPLLSVLGSGLGTMIMPGKLQSGFLYPLCDETADMLGEFPNGISWHNLIEEIEFTRTDDSKNDQRAEYLINPDERSGKKKGEASTQMRFSVQYMVPGTEFIQQIALIGESELERGAFYTALVKWFNKPARLGGMGAKGFGSFDAVVGDGDIVYKGGIPKVSPEIRALIKHYEDFIEQDETASWLYLLEAGKK